jgi:hypothetical protein
MLPPLPRCSGWAYSSLVSPRRVGLPRKGSPGRPAHRPFRGMLGVHSRCGLHTRAVTVFRDPLSEGFRPFVSSMPAPAASGWSESPGGPCTHWKAPPCHGAHPKQSSRLSPSGSGDAATAHLQSLRSEVLCCLRNGRYQSSAPIVTPAIRSNTLMMAEPSSLLRPAATTPYVELTEERQPARQVGVGEPHPNRCASICRSSMVRA